MKLIFYIYFFTFPFKAVNIQNLMADYLLECVPLALTWRCPGYLKGVRYIEACNQFKSLVLSN